jgi:hypothetical protein
VVGGPRRLRPPPARPGTPRVHAGGPEASLGRSTCSD